MTLRYKFTPGEVLAYDTDLSMRESLAAAGRPAEQARATFRLTETVKSVDAAGNATCSYRVTNVRGTGTNLGVAPRPDKSPAETGTFVVSPLGKLVSSRAAPSPGTQDAAASKDAGIMGILFSGESFGDCLSLPRQAVAAGQEWSGVAATPAADPVSRTYTKHRLTSLSDGTAEIALKVHSEFSAPPLSMPGAAMTRDQSGRILFDTATGALESLQSNVATDRGANGAAGTPPFHITMTLSMRRVAQ